jgi:hypothetical protein
MALGATCCLLPQATRVRRQAATTPPSPWLSQDASMCVPTRSSREARRVHVRLPGKTAPSFARQDGCIVCQAARLHHPPSNSHASITLHAPRASGTHVHVRRHMCMCILTCASSATLVLLLTPTRHVHRLTRHMSITHTPLAHTCASPTPFYPSLPREREREEEREREIDLGWGGRRRSCRTCVSPRMRAALLTTTSYCRYLCINM